MTLRTPRRRISPRTKRRYNAIKGFFRRALAPQHPSQADLIQITSSIAVNVTDISHKIGGLEQQLTEVSKQCHGINFLENNSLKSKSRVPSETRNEKNHQDIPSETQLKEGETSIVDTDKNNRVLRAKNEVELEHRIKHSSNEKSIQKSKNKKSKTDPSENDWNIDPRLFKQKIKTKYAHENFSAYSTNSCSSLQQNHPIPGPSNQQAVKRNPTKLQNVYQSDKMFGAHLKGLNPASYKYHREERPEKYIAPKCDRKPKFESKVLDQDFIADIIKRQYKPIKMFDKKQSDQSLCSAPVCRDRDFDPMITTNRHAPEEPLRLTCNCGGRHYIRYSHHSDCTDVRGVSDARLYNVKKNYIKKRHIKHAEDYNDSNIYDLIPVKEKTSPKSRRKFFEDNMRSNYYKEVPPSPRSNRPRLNLQAQMSESNYTADSIRNAAIKVSQVDENCYLPEMQNMRRNKHNNQADMQRPFGTISSPYQAFETDEHAATIETPLNKTQETILSEKTDKALCEIKDILQNFLLEIKKDASSHSAKSMAGTKIIENGSEFPNNGPSFNNYNTAQFPVPTPAYIPTIPTIANTCCYPVLPMCPLNYMQNSYAVPSTSFTCNNCDGKPMETNQSKKFTKTDSANDTYHSETEELVKQIYKFVSQSPTTNRTNDDFTKEEIRHPSGSKVFTSRSAGESIQLCKHNAKVGTPKMNCISKGCEALDSKVASVRGYSNDTNACYSDTILDKVSLEPTGSLSNTITESTTVSSETEKTKCNRFTKFMRALGLFKKTKKSVTDISDSESTIEETTDKNKNPFRQDITNYAMYSQEYYRPPPLSPRYHPEYLQDYRPPYNPDFVYRDPRTEQSTNYRSPYPQYQSGKSPTAPPYPYESYNHMQPQVPLCLKEVEVKSIACQSARKTTFFGKIARKIQPPPHVSHGNVQNNGSTQTHIAQEKPGLFNWKNTQFNVTERQMDPAAYAYNTKKKLAEKDANIKNAVLQKMFYKKNPFSPRNLIMRMLLGKENFEPPAYKPKMFL